MRREKRIGSLEVGKEGDVVIVDVTDYRQIAYQYGVNHTWMVFKGGRRIYSA
jgi:imidazolonepropionase